MNDAITPREANLICAIGVALDLIEHERHEAARNTLHHAREFILDAYGIESISVRTVSREQLARLLEAQGNA